MKSQPRFDQKSSSDPKINFGNEAFVDQLSEAAFSDIPDSISDEQMMKIKSERQQMSPDSLDYLINTFLIKEKLKPEEKRNVLLQFYQRFHRLSKVETENFPKVFSLLREQKEVDFSNLTMAQVKNIVHPLNIWELSALLAKVKETIHLSFGKNLVLVVGATAAGKSTFIQSCLGYKHIRGQDSEKRSCLTVPGGLREEHKKLKTSRSNQSCTLMVDTFELKSNEIEPGNFIGDTAGLGQNRGAEIEIANTVCLESVISEAASVRFVFLINQRNWGDRGNSIREYLAQFSSKFKDFSLIKNKIVYVLNNFSQDQIRDLNADLKEIQGTKATEMYEERGHRNLKDIIASLAQLTEQLKDWEEDDPIYDPHLIIYNPKSTSAKEILNKIISSDTKILNASSNTQVNFSTNCKNVIREEVVNLKNRAEKSISQELFSKAIYYMNLLKALSINIRKEQFTLIDLQDVQKAFLKSQDDASINWKKIIDSVKQRASKLSQSLIQDFTILREMDENETFLEIKKNEYESLKEITNFIQKLEPTYKSNLINVEFEIKKSEELFLKSYKENPSKKVCQFLQDYSKVFNPQFLSQMKKAMKQQYQQIVNDIQNIIEAVEFEKLDPYFIRLKKINERMVGSESSYQDIIKKFEEGLNIYQSRFKTFMEEKVNTKTKLSEEPFFGGFKKYCESQSKKMRSQQMKEKYVPLVKRIQKSFCNIMKKCISEVLLQKNYPNQRKMKIAWSNYEEIKSIKSSIVSQMVSEIKSELEILQMSCQDKYNKPPSRKEVKSLNKQLIFEDLEFIATRIQLYQISKTEDFSLDWKGYFKNALKRLELYIQDLKKEKQTIEIEGNQNVEKINEIYTTMLEIDDKLDALKSQTSSDEQSQVIKLQKVIEESQNDINSAVIKNILPEIERIMKSTNIDITLRIKRMCYNLDAISRIIDDFDDQETKKTLIEKRIEARNWIYNCNNQCFQTIQAYINSWKDQDNVSEESVIKFAEDLEKFQKQTSFSIVKQLLAKRQQDYESQQQKLYKQLNEMIKSFHTKAKISIDSDEIATVKAMLENWKNFKRIDEIFPKLQITQTFQKVNDKVEETVNRQLAKYEVDFQSNKLDLDIFENFYKKAQEFNEVLRIKEKKKEAIQYFNAKVLEIAKTFSILENVKLAEEKKLAQTISELIDLNQETQKFKQIIENSKESIKLLQKMEGLNKKLEKLMLENWCEPICLLIKEKSYVTSLDMLRKYKILQSYLQQGKKVLNLENSNTFIYQPYSTLAQREKQNQEDQLKNLGQAAIDWNIFSKDLMNEQISKYSTIIQSTEEEFKYNQITNVELQTKIQDLQKNIRRFPKQETKKLKDKMISLKDKIKQNKSRDLREIKENHNDLSWLLLKIKDSQKDIQIQKPAINLFEKKLLSFVEYSTFEQGFRNFNSMSNNLQESIIPFLIEIQALQLKDQMVPTIQKLESGIKKNINKKMIEEIKKINGDSKNQQLKEFLSFLETLKEFYIWIGNKKSMSIFSDDFFNQLVNNFSEVLKVLETSQKKIQQGQNQQQEEDFMFYVQIYRKIEDILGNQSQILQEIVTKYHIDTTVTQSKLKDKRKVIQEAKLTLQSFNPEKVQFHKLSKAKKEKQLQNIENAYQIYVNDPMIQQNQNDKQVLRIKKEMNQEIERIITWVETDTKAAFEFVVNKMEDIQFPLSQRARTIFQLIQINSTKKYVLLKTLQKQVDSIKLQQTKHLQQIISKWEKAKDRIYQLSPKFFEKQKKINQDCQLQKIKNQADMLGRKNSQISKLYQQQKKRLIGQDQAQANLTKNTFKAKKTQVESQFQKDKRSFYDENEKKFQQIRYENQKQIKAQIIEFVKSSLLLEKIFDEYQMQNEKKKFRNRMSGFGKDAKKKILQMVYEVASKSEYQKYRRIFLGENKIFQSSNNAVWQKNTEHFTIDKVVDKLQGTTISKMIQASIVKSFNIYSSEFKKWTQQYRISPGYKLIRELVDQIKRDGVTMSKHYFEEQKLNPETPEKLLGKIFALMAMLKASASQEDCMVSYEFKPHPAQLTAVFLLLNFVNDQKIENAMAQIETGEGKSVVLGGLSAYLSVCGYQVFCACYSSYLSQRDAGSFEKLFKELGVIHKIKYGTFQNLADMKLKESRTKILDLLTTKDDRTGKAGTVKNWWYESLKNLKIEKSSRSIMLIDEIDVFFDEAYFGNLYRSAISLTDPTVREFMIAAWKQKSQIEKLSEFQNLCKRYPNLKNILKEEVLNELSYEIDEFNYENSSKDYQVIQDQIQYRVKDGYDSSITQGLRTMIAYLQENKKQKISNQTLEKVLEISLIVAEFSYAQLPMFFDNILGVTGTLKQMSAFKSSELQKRYGVKKKFFIPSVYGDAKDRRECKRRVVPIAEYGLQIFNQIKRVHDTGRPVLVFFKSQAELESFFSSQIFQSLLIETQYLDETHNQNERNKIIRNTGYQNKITLMTDSFGRGTDFKISDKTAELGGLHVIQTYLSEQTSDQIQIQGRTARQSAKGSYLCLINSSHLEILSLSGKQDGQTINEKLIEEARKAMDQKKVIPIKDKVNKAAKIHQQTLDFFSSNLDIAKLLKKVQSLNSFEANTQDKISRVVLGIDGTCSMSVALAHVLNILSQSLNNLKSLLKESKVKKSFEIKIVIYRNYNSSAEKILQFTKFERKIEILQNFLKNISVDGGYGNQALQLLFDHVNNSKKTKDLIVLGDAPANTKQETDYKRQGNKKAHKKTPLVYAKEQVEKLKQKQIKVHSLYIQTCHDPEKVQTYFQNLSSSTKGKAEKFDINASNASGILSKFIVDRIIQSTSENTAEADQLKKLYNLRYVARN